MPAGALAAKQAAPARADDGEANALRLPSHRFPPTISATAESAAFDSGNSIGSLRSAERSAGVSVSITMRALSAVTIAGRPMSQDVTNWIVAGPLFPSTK